MSKTTKYEIKTVKKNLFLLLLQTKIKITKSEEKKIVTNFWSMKNNQQENKLGFLYLIFIKKFKVGFIK